MLPRIGGVFLTRKEGVLDEWLAYRQAFYLAEDIQRSQIRYRRLPVSLSKGETGFKTVMEPVVKGDPEFIDFSYSDLRWA